MSDEMDLLAEQVKMLSGEIAFSSSTLKRLMEQSVNDPESSRNQVYICCYSFQSSTQFDGQVEWDNDLFDCYNLLQLIRVSFRFSSKRQSFYYSTVGYKFII